jgi:hypothetical protein
MSGLIDSLINWFINCYSHKFSCFIFMFSNYSIKEQTTNNTQFCLKKFSVGHRENLLSLHASYTTLVTASSSGQIRFWRHSRPPPESDKSYNPLSVVEVMNPEQDELGAVSYTQLTKSLTCLIFGVHKGLKFMVSFK